jgi:methylmalonyl-CoA mutase
VLLVPLESPRAASARLSFAGDLLLPAGIETITLGVTGETATEADLREALKATTVACLCGTDDAYASSAASVADALRGAGVTTVLLAGQAKAAPDAKIDTFLFRDCDAVAIQEQLLDELGVSR